MHQNINNNNVKSLDAKLYSAKYYDFMLYKGETHHQDVSELENLSMVDFSDLNIVDGVLYSKTSWSGATNEGVKLNNIGFTGMDNGFIYFQKDRITNAEFLDLLLNSEYTIEENDNRLFLTPITGNTQMYDYPMFLYDDGNEKYIVCKGGFYQGFFKLYGHKYEVLPYKLDNEWVMHFDIRPRTDYGTQINTVNYTHSDNDGIFFFMGLRAENKFWPFYKTDSSVMKDLLKNEAQNEGYFDGCGESGGTIYDSTKNDVVHLENEWVADELNEFKYDGYFAIGDEYLMPDFSSSSKDYVKPNTDSVIVKNNYTGKCECDNYFNDEYYDGKTANENGKFVEDDFIGSGATIDEEGYSNYDGYHMAEYGIVEIETDNKFLLFDRTPSGFTVDNWEEGTKLVLTRRQQWPNANYFLLMNRTCTGYTVDTIQNYNEENEYDYNIHKDIRGNVFALRVKKDGSIGYRYGVFDCENENRYKVIEEYSKPGIVKSDEWNNVNVRFSVIDGYRNGCDDRNRKMRIYIYVNGFLVFVSKNIDAFTFKHIDKDDSSKQEAVPYNISLGGGTLGLLESILPDYYAISDYILPIERDFCGTFIGDIKSFKMYGGFVDYSTIRNYLS
jgi:hypothetical protein